MPSTMSTTSATIRGAGGNKKKPGNKNVVANDYTEEQVNKALMDYKNGDLAALTIEKAADKHKVPIGVLKSRLKGSKSPRAAHGFQQNLSPPQELVLVQYIKSKGWRGEPLDNKHIVDVANAISGKEMGTRWIYNFKSRHIDLKSRWAKPGEAKRASGLNRVTRDSFFAALGELQTEDIHPECIWNCDEKGFQMNGGHYRRRLVVDSSQQGPKYTAQDDRRNVTILECINAAGNNISPFLIHPGAAPDLEWVKLCNGGVE